MRRRLRRVVRWACVAVGLSLLALLAPIGYVEAMCRGDGTADGYRPIIGDAAHQRPEANSYLTYPEWHIVYAYEGLAQTLRHGDEHAFDYSSAVAGFWRSYCALNASAQRHGGADLGTRQTIYVIGASFTVEMALKAVYEETIGRLSAWGRGATKSPQDSVVAAEALAYAAFLGHTPWYKYPFDLARAKLWAAPPGGVRGWERRLGIGAEWWAKGLYARVIGGAVAATGEAALTIRSVVSDVTPKALAAIHDVTVVDTTRAHVVIETPRYAHFTEIVREISTRGGNIVEIAGNDDVLVTVLHRDDDPPHLPAGVTVLSSLRRDGFDDRRLLIEVTVPLLATLVRDTTRQGHTFEHVYDY